MLSKFGSLWYEKDSHNSQKTRRVSRVGCKLTVVFRLRRRDRSEDRTFQKNTNKGKTTFAGPILTHVGFSIMGMCRLFNAFFHAQFHSIKIKNKLRNFKFLGAYIFTMSTLRLSGFPNICSKIAGFCFVL